jgi:hypothetical protein
MFDNKRCITVIAASEQRRTGQLTARVIAIETHMHLPAKQSATARQRE